ncbi:hypothetical protein LTS17_009789 [Exophiala oligosperma]
MSENGKIIEDDKTVDQRDPLSEEQQEFSKIMSSLKLDPMGVVCLGKDGVLRSLTADRDVIDAVALAPKHIKAMLDRMPFSQEAENIWRGVDGTTVPKELWYNPDKDDLPPPLSEEEKEEARTMMEENKLDGTPHEGASSCCGPAMMSDHKILNP